MLSEIIILLPNYIHKKRTFSDKLMRLKEIN